MAKTYESTFESTFESIILSKVLSYFRTRPRAVAGRIDLKLRHDVVHRSPMPSQSSASFRGLEGGFRTSQRLSFKKVLRCPKTVFQASKTRETFDMFLKEEMKEAWAIVENASIS
jgi:hypothetical protein